MVHDDEVIELLKKEGSPEEVDSAVIGQWSGEQIDEEYPPIVESVVPVQGMAPKHLWINILTFRS